MRKLAFFFFDRLPERDFALIGNEQYSRDGKGEKITPDLKLVPWLHEGTLLR
jgi:hypothetical protein